MTYTRYVCTTYVHASPSFFIIFQLSAWRYRIHSISASAFIVSISRMWPTSIILSAAVILAASSVSASNDPRECEGEIPMPKQI